MQGRLEIPAAPIAGAGPRFAGVVSTLIAAGATHLDNGWPFACFPTFETRVRTADVTALEFVARDERGEPIDLSSAVAEARSRLGPAWLAHTRIVMWKSNSRGRAAAASLWDEVRRGNARLVGVQKVEVHQVKRSTIPGEWDRILGDDLLFVLDQSR